METESQERAHLIGDILDPVDQTLESGFMPTARSIRVDARRRFLRIGHRQALADAVPDPPAPGEAIHTLSGGRYDSWTWVPHMLGWAGRADELYASTWALNRETVVELAELHDAGLIAPGKVAFITGIYFKRRDPAIYGRLLATLRDRGGRCRAILNHSKIILLSARKRNLWLSVEGSANMTGNPRMEQFVLTNHRGLYAFHREWMEDALACAPDDRHGPAAPNNTRRRSGFSQRRAALGVLAVRRDRPSRAAILAAKADTVGDPALDSAFAADLADLVRQHSPALPPGCVVTTPPQGASAPGPYYAEGLARSVAVRLGLDYRDTLRRADPKTAHGVHPSLAQTTYAVAGRRPAAAVVVDDLATTGRTMRLALDALRDAKVPAWGFVYSGV